MRTLPPQQTPGTPQLREGHPRLLYIERTLHALQSAGPDTLGDGDKQAHKKEFNFTLQTDADQLRDVENTAHISEAPHKIARPSPLDDPPDLSLFVGH